MYSKLNVLEINLWKQNTENSDFDLQSINIHFGN